MLKWYTLIGAHGDSFDEAVASMAAKRASLLTVGAVEKIRPLIALDGGVLRVPLAEINYVVATGKFILPARHACSLGVHGHHLLSGLHVRAMFSDSRVDLLVARCLEVYGGEGAHSIMSLVLVSIHDPSHLWPS